VIHHTILLRFRADAPPDRRRAAVEAIRTLPALIPGVAAFEVEVGEPLGPTGAHVAVRARFADVAAWAAYQEHPAHERVRQRDLADLVDTSLSFQREVAG
jgi:hypothetical protein